MSNTFEPSLDLCAPEYNRMLTVLDIPIGLWKTAKNHNRTTVASFNE